MQAFSLPSGGMSTGCHQAHMVMLNGAAALGLHIEEKNLLTW